RRAARPGTRTGGRTASLPWRTSSSSGLRLDRGSCLSRNAQSAPLEDALRRKGARGRRSGRDPRLAVQPQDLLHAVFQHQLVQLDLLLLHLVVLGEEGLLVDLLE